MAVFVVGPCFDLVLYFVGEDVAVDELELDVKDVVFLVKEFEQMTVAGLEQGLFLVGIDVDEGDKGLGPFR